MLQPVSNLPDHGFGRLGQVAHGVLTASLDSPPAFPRLYLGYNTMPDPPIRVPCYLGFEADPSGWDVCGQDLLLYLRVAEASLRTQPIPPEASHSEAYRRVARITRVDAIVLLCRSGGDDAVLTLALDRSRRSVVFWAPPWDERNVVAARPRQDALALALQRAGIREAFPDPPDAELQVLDGAIDTEVVRVLATILDAQYDRSRVPRALSEQP